MSLTRKQFLSSVISGAAGALLLVACSSDDGSGGSTPDAPAGGNCAANGTTSVIGSNHGHTIVVAKADITAGAQKSYDIRGSASHPHTVTVTAALFAMLASNTAITVTSSSDDGHSHGVTVTCA
jgi:hypothetical protein